MSQTKEQLRSAILTARPRRAVMTFPVPDGDSLVFEVMQPTLAIREQFLVRGKEGNDFQETYLVVACTLVPGTDEKVFAIEDAEEIRTKLTSAADSMHRQLALKALQLMTESVEAERKKSAPSPVTG